VLSATFGLEEIKTEVAAIEAAVLSATFGLAEIKTEVAAIEAAVLSPTFGLEEIKTEVAAIEAAVLSPTFGLEEIKTEIVQILDTLAGGENFTTGAFVVDTTANSVLVNVLNRTAEEVEVTVTRFVFDAAGGIVDTTSDTLTIPADETATTVFSVDASDPDTARVEIQFQGLVDGVYGWVGARTEDENADLAPSTFIPSNIFSNQNLSPLLTP